jgi:hypothetical protein
VTIYVLYCVLYSVGYKNIEDIEVGYLVWAKNVDTGEYEWKPVTQTWIVEDKEIYQISVETLDGDVQKNKEGGNMALIKNKEDREILK